MNAVQIGQLSAFAGETVTVRGWVTTVRSSGKLAFVNLRDGTGYLQAVVSKRDVAESAWNATQGLTQETSIAVTGTVRADERAEGGFELTASDLTILGPSTDFPISPKEHGTSFLFEHRHLWLRSRRQVAIARVRHEVIQAIRDFFHQDGFTLVDTPILTGAIGEEAGNLFSTEYFDLGKAYLAQTGQLYVEAAAAALGKVYCFGPTFRAEKSKTRRHLTEFWMVEPEVAFMELPGLLDLAEEFVAYIVARVLDRRREELKVLERDVSKLEAVTRPFPRMTYDEAAALLKQKGVEFEYGGDLGGTDETILSQMHAAPLMVTHYPASAKAFYMQPDALSPDKALCVDVLAPEGYGEIIGGSQRIHDYDLLVRRIQEHGLPEEAFKWYLEIRKFGTVPHSGFGMGIERTVTWICGVHHLRECIPYPRTLSRIYP